MSDESKILEANPAKLEGAASGNSGGTPDLERRAFMIEGGVGAASAVAGAATMGLVHHELQDDKHEESHTVTHIL